MVYTNPANENIILDAEEDIFFCNSLEQIVIHTGNPKGKTTIRISNLRKGTYFLKSGARKQKLVKE